MLKTSLVLRAMVRRDARDHGNQRALQRGHHDSLSWDSHAWDPYMDGARSVTQGPIGPGENSTYRFSACPPGTHYYHSHMVM